MSVLIAGNYCHDTLLGAGPGLEAGNTEPRLCLGGSAAYISRVLGTLEVPFEVVANVGDDFAFHGEVARAPRVAPGSRTTHFRNVYRGDGRREETLETVCEPLARADFAHLGPRRFEVGLACGVAFELTLEALDELRARSRVLIADLQGLIRATSANGRITHARLEDTVWASRIGQLDFLKASREEAAYLDLAQVRRQTRLIVTEGADGCTLYEESRELRVAPFPAREVDPTGAGDCFVAGFAFGILRGLELEAALRLANFSGALAVSQVGVPRLSARDFEAVVGPGKLR